MIEKEIDHEYTDEIVCPYCGHESEDSWEASEDSDDEECDECGKHFAYDSETTRTYTSRKVDCLNGGEHAWTTGALHPLYPNARYCKACRKHEWGTPKEVVL